MSQKVTAVTGHLLQLWSLLGALVAQIQTQIHVLLQLCSAWPSQCDFTCCHTVFSISMSTSWIQVVQLHGVKECMYHDLWLYRKCITSGIVWFSEIGQVSGEARYLVSDSIPAVATSQPCGHSFTPNNYSWVALKYLVQYCLSLHICNTSCALYPAPHPHCSVRSNLWRCILGIHAFLPGKLTSRASFATPSL